MTDRVFRALHCLSLALVLTGCDIAADKAPFVDSRMPPSLPARLWPPTNWAWGLVEQEKAPPLRYGVGSPPGIARGNVVILTGYGETAEGWFETANALIARGYVVWVLEGAGQGGSGRYGGPRDRGRAPDFEADIAGATALVRAVIRPAEPVTLLASGTAAPVALVAAQRGLPVRSLILSGAGSIPESEGWTRPGNDAQLTPRQRAQSDWMFANPDLRMGGPTRQWRRSFDALNKQTSDPALRSGIRVPVLAIEPVDKATPCVGIIRCRIQTIPSAVPYQLANGPARMAWLAAVNEALDDRVQ